MRLLVVIVSYRVTELTIDCLRSLKEEVEQTPGARWRFVKTVPVVPPPIGSGKPLQTTIGNPG